MCAELSNASSAKPVVSSEKRLIEKQREAIALRGILLGNIDYCQGIIDWLENEEEHDPLRGENG